MANATPSLESMLHKRYPAGEYALLYEVRNAAGYSANRSADAIAVGLWPSRGMQIIGFEIKRSRADWLKELRRPEKAEESLFEFCDQWFLVVSDAVMVKDGELPPTWGLLAPRGRSLYQFHTAPKREKVTPPDRHLLACLLKRATDGMIPAGEINARIEEAREEGRQGEVKRQLITFKALEAKIVKLKKYQLALGVQDWASDDDLKRAGERFAEFERMRSDANSARMCLAGIREQAARMANAAAQLNKLADRFDPQPSPAEAAS